MFTLVDFTETIFFSGTRTYSNPAYNELLKSIKNKIQEGKFFLKDNMDRKSILRIGIHSLGSPMWLPHRKSLHSIETTRDLDMFIFCLRALVRSAYAVAVVTIPTHLYHEVSVKKYVIWIILMFPTRFWIYTDFQKISKPIKSWIKSNEIFIIYLQMKAFY